jgi:para-nitrobenzyl esterase
MFTHLSPRGRRGTLFALVSMALAAAIAPQPGLSKQPDVVVSTNSGSVGGTTSTDGSVLIWRGIPYAAPPVGPLRWVAPQPPASWSGILDATGPAKTPCPQTGQYASVNEDCLYLNVFAPVRNANNKLPVMVWIHGGGQINSAANDYNPDTLATRGTPVVVVTFNYRLNIFAFFAHQALTAENPQLGSGNYAGLDQQAALRWVRDNIANFGGDPGNVTIFGQSGGAQAVCVLMASPPASGLFQRAISESGACQWELYPSLTASEHKGAVIANQLGCSGSNPLPCLRALPTSVILAKQQGIGADTSAGQPAWGGGAFPLPMRETISSGQFNKVPLIQGGVQWEAMFGIAPMFDGAGHPVTAAQYPQLLQQYYGASRVDAIQQQYPLSNYLTPSYAFLAGLTDSAVGGSNRTGLCNVHAANQIASLNTPVYAYEFADNTAQYPAPIFNPPRGDLVGASHTTELSYLFDNVPLTPAQRHTADVMIGYWTNFAATGNPNGKGLPNWPVYKPTEQNVMLITANSIASDTQFYDRHKCKFWAEQGYDILAGPYPTPTATGPVNQ